ncbi:hypothetical protein [Thauera aminoaromatica]|nr:hypothetical protein [Thauera aminoaromatica]
MKQFFSSRCNLHGVADLLQPSNEAEGGIGSVGAVEVGGAEVVPL